MISFTIWVFFDVIEIRSLTTLTNALVTWDASSGQVIRTSTVSTGAILMNLSIINPSLFGCLNNQINIESFMAIESISPTKSFPPKIGMNPPFLSQNCTELLEVDEKNPQRNQSPKEFTQTNQLNLRPFPGRCAHPASLSK